MPIRITTTQAAALGIDAKPKPGSHEAIVRTYSDALLEAVIEGHKHRNLRDYRDHETRWLGDRIKAARAERRRRKQLSPDMETARPADRAAFATSDQ